jgi:hypothetical protein
MSHRRFLLSLVCAASLRPAAAAAQARSVDDLLRDGVQQRREHHDADAFASFNAAWEQCRCAEARVQMALAAQALGRWCDALDLLDRALAVPGDPFIAQHRAALDEERRAIASHTGTVRVEVDPPAARIALDGAPIAPAPAAHCAPVGEHSLTVTAPGRAPLARTLAVEPDARVDLGLALPLLSPPRPPSAWPRVARTARWVTLGAGVLGLAGALAATLVEADRVARWNDPACLADGLSRAENCGAELAAADEAHTLAVAGYVTAGALTAGTAALWVLAGRGTVTRERSRAMCLPSMRGVGVTCGAAF